MYQSNYQRQEEYINLVILAPFSYPWPCDVVAAIKQGRVVWVRGYLDPKL